MSGHTRGPWVVGPHPESTRLDAVFAGQRKVAYCQSLFGRPHVGFEECEANARLISAAPNLLEALDWALAEIEGRTRYDPTCVYNAEEQRENCLDKVRAALAKARGEA